MGDGSGEELTEQGHKRKEENGRNKGEEEEEKEKDRRKGKGQVPYLYFFFAHFQPCLCHQLLSHESAREVSDYLNLQHNSVGSHLLQACTRYDTRNSSGDEIANVNFLYHIVHVLPLAKAPSSE